jgi:hypothetical protein
MMMMMDMMICYLFIYVSPCFIDGIDGPPWTLDRVKEWTIYGLIFFVIVYVTYDYVYCDVVYGSLACFVD